MVFTEDRVPFLQPFQRKLVVVILVFSCILALIMVISSMTALLPIYGIV